MLIRTKLMHSIVVLFKTRCTWKQVQYIFIKKEFFGYKVWIYISSMMIIFIRRRIKISFEIDYILDMKYRRIHYSMFYDETSYKGKEYCDCVLCENNFEREFSILFSDHYHSWNNDEFNRAFYNRYFIMPLIRRWVRN